MRILSVMVLLALVFFCYGQDNGRAIQAAGQEGRLRVNSPNVDPYMAESTSPFFSDQWMLSTLVFANGKVQSGLLVRLDLFENKIYYLDEFGNENISTSEFREIVMADTASQKVHRFINSSAIKASGAEPGWYELLCTGNIELYKKTIKALPRSMTQNSEGEPRPLETSTQLYLLTKGKLFVVKRTRDVPVLIEEKKSELLEYIRVQKLTGKSLDDIIEIVNYSNTLFK